MSEKKIKPVKASPQAVSSRSTYILGGLAVLVVAIVVIVGVLWQSTKTEPRADGYGSVQNAAVGISVLDQGVVAIGAQGAAKTVDIYEDALCPYCAELENTYGQEIAQKVDSGAIAVRYHMLDFLNRGSSSGNYSTRAAAAAQCVATSGTASSFSAFHSALFATTFQPAENASSDRTNDELATLATNSGAPDVAADCITSGSGVDAASANAAAARQALAATGSSGTPTVVVDGTVVDALNDNNWVAAL